MVVEDFIRKAATAMAMAMAIAMAMAMAIAAAVFDVNDFYLDLTVEMIRVI